jgi:hypothetical protein
LLGRYNYVKMPIVRKVRPELNGAEIVQAIAELIDIKFRGLDQRVERVEVLLEQVDQDIWNVDGASKLRDGTLQEELQALAYKVK